MDCDDRERIWIFGCRDAGHLYLKPTAGTNVLVQCFGDMTQGATLGRIEGDYQYRDANATDGS